MTRARRDDARPVALRDLARVERAYRRAQAATEARRLERNQRIREAIQAGATYQEISDAAGMTRGRVSQIATAPPPAAGDVAEVVGFAGHRGDPVDCAAPPTEPEAT